MSGGSFDYLCWKEADQLLTALGTLGEMVDALESEWPGSAAAHDTRAFRDRLVELEQDLERSPLKELRTVWHDVEWWQSMDYGRDRAKTAVLRYGRPKRHLMSWIPRGTPTDEPV